MSSPAAAWPPSGAVLGVDIGGSAIKAAVVDVDTGRLRAARTEIATPRPSTPDRVGAVLADIASQVDWSGPIGVTFPAVIKRGIARSAANVDPSWLGADVDAILSAATGQDVTVLNDADAAGLAEVRFGAARDVPGVVIVLTFGTGIGSAVFIDGALVPNTELGHLELDGHDAESRAAASIKAREMLSYPDWAKRVNAYLSHVQALFSPDLFVLGGGISSDADQWVPLLELATEVRPAQLHNDAGIVGAAMAVARP